MEWSNIIVIACAALGATAWFTSHLVLFYVLGSIALVLSLLFMWGPVFIGISDIGEGRIVNGILFIVIGILIRPLILSENRTPDLLNAIQIGRAL